MVYQKFRVRFPAEDPSDRPRIKMHFQTRIVGGLHKVFDRAGVILEVLFAEGENDEMTSSPDHFLEVFFEVFEEIIPEIGYPAS